MTEKPNNDKHIELSDKDLKKVVGGKATVTKPDTDPPSAPGQATEGGGA